MMRARTVSRVFLGLMIGTILLGLSKPHSAYAERLQETMS